ncbi:MAG: folate-binding protein YgfZ [Pseudomonadales bacterium]
MTDQDASRHAPAATAQPLPLLAATAFVGADCAEFLQGYLTCDTLSLMQAPMAGKALAAALCSLKGRVLANGWAFAPPDSAQDTIVLVTHASVAEQLREHLRRYMVFSKTTVQPVAGHVLGTVDQPDNELSIRIDDRRQLLLPQEQDATAESAGSAAASAGSTFMDSLLDAHRVLVSQASSEVYLPQMLGLSDWGAVDFTKGCYLGQEVVARAEHRGQVKRQLRALTPSTEPVQQHLVEGSTVTDQQGKTLGTVVAVRSATATPGTIAALAVLNTGSLPHNGVLQIENISQPFTLADAAKA